MRLLMLGAGGVGGYFGARLHAGGADITFLVRPKRAATLRERGLRIYGVRGDLIVKDPKLLVSGETARPSVANRDQGTVQSLPSSDASDHLLPQPGEGNDVRPRATVLGQAAKDNFDAVIISCKAYDLASSIDAVRPYVGSNTFVVPLLNGLRHLETLDAAFGAERVLGGLAQVSSTIDVNGDIKQLTEVQAIAYGARSDAQQAGAEALDRILKLGQFDARLSRNIMLEMWEKFVLLTSLAGMTCLLRANVGEIAATQDGAALMSRTLDDCAATATAAGFAPRGKYLDNVRAVLTQKGSVLEASMRRDMEAGGATEADHIVGDMLRRATDAGIDAVTLRTAYCHLQAHELRRSAAAR